MKALNNYLLVGLSALITVFSCGNNQKENAHSPANSPTVEKDTTIHKPLEISCELIKNEKRLNTIVDSLEVINGKSNYACRCFPDDETSNDLNKIVVQILKDDELRLRGVAMFKYDTLTNSFYHYDMK